MRPPPAPPQASSDSVNGDLIYYARGGTGCLRVHLHFRCREEEETGGKCQTDYAKGGEKCLFSRKR